MAKRTEVLDGVWRLWARTRDIPDPETGEIVASVPSPDLLLIDHTDGVAVYRRQKSGPLVLVTDDAQIRAAIAERGHAQVRMRTAAATELANAPTRQTEERLPGDAPYVEPDNTEAGGYPPEPKPTRGAK